MPQNSHLLPNNPTQIPVISPLANVLKVTIRDQYISKIPDSQHIEAYIHETILESDAHVIQRTTTLSRSEYLVYFRTETAAEVVEMMREDHVEWMAIERCGERNEPSHPVYHRNIIDRGGTNNIESMQQQSLSSNQSIQSDHHTRHQPSVRRGNRLSQPIRNNRKQPIAPSSSPTTGFRFHTFCTGEMIGEAHFASLSHPLHDGTASMQGGKLHITFSSSPENPCKLVHSVRIHPSSVTKVYVARDAKLDSSLRSLPILDAIIVDCSFNARLYDKHSKRLAIDSAAHHMFECCTYALFFARQSHVGSPWMKMMDSWCKRAHIRKFKIETCSSVGLPISPDIRFSYQHLPSLTSLDPHSRYGIEYLLTHHFVSSNQLTQKFLDELAALPPGDQHRFLFSYITHRTHSISSKLTEFKDSLIQSSTSHISLESYDHTNSFLLRRVVVTPSTFYVKPPQMEHSCRISTQFNTYHAFFLRIQFCGDENTSEDSNFFKGSLWKERSVAILGNGITVAGLLYKFLGFGSSQLRVHSAFLFYETDLTKVHIFSNIGKLDLISHLPAFVARFGQAFSSTETQIFLDVCNIRRIEDIKRNGFTFTDGCGRMHEDLMRQLKTSVHRPSAVQIRYGGCKGMLAHYPQMQNGLALEFRPSQEKFESEDQVLHVCGCSMYRSGYLNRQFVNVLHNRGVHPQVFLDMQEQMLTRLSSVQDSSRHALELISKHGSFPVKLQLQEVLRAGISTTDTFISNCLRCLTRSQLTQLKKKVRIYIPDPDNIQDNTVAKKRNSALLYGVPDEYGVLKNGEVFVQYHVDDFSETVLVQGDVFVMKSPCHHPGDLRRLRAVHCQELKHLRNVIVFSTQGERPEPDKIAKGDLDGDSYCVMWHPDLLKFGRVKNDEPFPYDHPPKSGTEDNITDDNLIQYFGRKLETHHMLGHLSNLHLMQVDKYGFDSPQALCLIPEIQKALDEPKTGIAPAVPDGLTSVRPIYMPHFRKRIRKKQLQSPSQSVLTLLYRQVLEYERKYERKLNAMSNDTRVHATLERLASSPWEEHLLYRETFEVDTLLGVYKSNLKSIMILNSIPSEASVLTFTFGSKKQDRDGIRESIIICLRHIQQKFESMVEQGKRHHSSLSSKQIRAAFIHICFKRSCDSTINPAEQFEIEKHGVQQVVKEQFLGLPWVIMQVAKGIEGVFTISRE